jgi:predicted secreted protein
MDIITSVVVYLSIWWLVLYTVLPWGVKPEENPQTGNAASAPADPRLRRKFLVTSGISAIIWLVVWFLIQHDVIDFRSIAAAMMQEDKAK